jgi:hypothetical protein
METRTKITTALSALGLAAGLSLLGLRASQAKADGTVACSSVVGASARSEVSQGQIAVLDSRNLYRFQARPWARIPEGVALRVRVPAGMTAADLHNTLSDCARTAKDQSSPLCVQGASVKVSRSGGSYIVSITSDSRSAALEIQRRAATPK